MRGQFGGAGLAATRVARATKTRAKKSIADQGPISRRGLVSARRMYCACFDSGQSVASRAARANRGWDPNGQSVAAVGLNPRIEARAGQSRGRRRFVGALSGRLLYRPQPADHRGRFVTRTRNVICASPSRSAVSNRRASVHVSAFVQDMQAGESRSLGPSLWPVKASEHRLGPVVFRALADPSLSRQRGCPCAESREISSDSLARDVGRAELRQAGMRRRVRRKGAPRTGSVSVCGVAQGASEVALPW